MRRDVRPCIALVARNRGYESFATARERARRNTSFSNDIHKILHRKGGSWTRLIVTPGNLHTAGYHLIILGNVLIEAPPCPCTVAPRCPGTRSPGYFVVPYKKRCSFGFSYKLPPLSRNLKISDSDENCEPLILVLTTFQSAVPDMLNLKYN